MADYYCDHGAYPAYAAIPTWNTAQEGDGKAPGLATPAIASFLINAVAVAGNTIAIAGVTLTAVASGATAAQFNVGASTSAQADNIATAINAATATVGASVATGTPQLRNLMYARGPSGGAPADTVQIMTRCGSADFNHASNSNMALASSGWGTPPTITQFSGGASGAWGYLINAAALWPSGVAAGTYGAWRSGSGAQPMHGPSTLSLYADTVFVSCNGQTITMPSNTSVTLNRDGANYVYEDGSGAVAAWTGRSGVLTYAQVISGANVVSRRPTGSAVRISERVMTHGRFVITVDLGTTLGSFYGPVCADTAGAEHLFENLKLIYTNISTATAHQFITISNSGKVCLRGGSVTYPSNLVPNFIYCNTSAWQELHVENFDIIYTGSPPAPTAALLAISNTPSNSRYVFKNVRNIGLPAPQKLFSLTTPASTPIVLIGDSCEGFDVPATLVGFSATSKTYPDSMLYMNLYNMGPKRGMTFEAPEGYVQWWSGQDFPTLSALLPDGSAWSLRYRWLSSTTLAICDARPFQIWRASETVVGAGYQTITFNVLLDPATASQVSKGHIAVGASYVSNVTSGRKYAHSAECTTKNALAASTAAWALGATYNGYTKAKVVLTLPDAIKQNTEIEYSLYALRPAPSSDQYVFVDPEPVLS